MGFIIGSIIAAGVAAASAIAGNAAAKKRQKKALAQQKELNAYNAELNYQYGEMAADNAHERQLALNKSENLQNKVEDAQEAGLSVGLLYGGGGIGGSGGGRASQGGGASGQGGEAGEAVEQYEAAALGLEAQRIKYDYEIQKAEKKKIEAETEEIIERTESDKIKSPIENYLLKQQAISHWIDNVRKDWENDGNGDAKSVKGEYWDTYISKAGNFDRKQAAEIAKALSEEERNKAAAALDTDKKLQLWEDVLNARRREDAEATKAAAIKLAAEWSTGEYTNWKTWSELANSGIDAIKSVIGIAK